MSNVQMFPHAQNLLFNGGTFSQSHQHYYNVGKDAGLNNLKQYIATDAMFDAAERFPLPKCHPGTREKVIKAIMDWINNPEAEEQAMWLYGPAGGGKSAIAQSIAILLQKMLQDSKYAASFFFAKDAPGRGDGNKLFPTIAYQLAINFPSFRPHLDAAMINNPTLPTKSMDIQLRDLIIEPLKHVENWPAHRPTVIIDGLDECAGTKRMQSALLSSLCKAITEHHIPLRFLIVSRPEYWIADHFQVGDFLHVARQISLHDDNEADAGIEKYLLDEFSRIYEENLPLMSSVSLPWPPEHLITRFVENASGQFVYASTVIKFVGDASDFCDPQEQLRILANPGPHDATAFSDLDRLYATILAVYPRPKSMKLVLAGILGNFHETVIQEFFGIPLGEIRLVLRAISSLIRNECPEYPEMYCVLESTYGPPLFSYGTSISFTHLSFREFLEDQSRSGCHWVDRSAVEAHLCHTILTQGREMLQSCLGEKVSDIEQSISRIGLSRYRALLGDLRHLLDIYHHLPFVMEEIQDIDSILHTVLALKPICLVHTSHILCFATNLNRWIKNVPLTKKPFKFHQELLKSIRYSLDVIIGISTKQLLEKIPIHMPVFSYLTAHSIWGLSHSIDIIKAEMGITYEDIISELQHLHGFAHLSFYIHTHINDDGAYVAFDNHAHIDIGWRVLSDELYKHVQDGQQIATWDNIRLRCLVSCKDRIMSRNWNNENSYATFMSVLTYMDHRVSDINSPDYFQDDLRRMILDMVIHPEFPDIVQHTDKFHDTTSKKFVMGVLYWLDRQMTGTSKKLIEEYDNTLLQTMQSAVKNIYLKAYLPHFTNTSSSNLIMTDISCRLSVNICISNELPNGTPSIIEENHAFHDEQYSDLIDPGEVFDDLHRFHNTMMTSQSSGIISPDDWYPHLTVYLFVMLVRLHYSMLKPWFEDHWTRAPRKVFGLLLKCMPYAIPTEQNLNAMRALHHMCPEVDRKRRWRPPYGFCSLAIDFLKKYDESSLSSLEFTRIKTWLDELKTHESKRIVVAAESRPHFTSHDDYTTDEDD